MNKLQNAIVAYTFDDFTLIPQYSTIKSRKDPDVSTMISEVKYEIPIIASPMNTICEEEMLVTMGQLKGIGVIHRYMTIEQQVAMCEAAITRIAASGISVDPFQYVYAAIGATGDYIERAQELFRLGVKNFCIDVANGHNIHSIEAVQQIKRLMPHSKVMSGNVCSYDGAGKLAESGADSIRVGVGGGAVCKTRLVTGHGIPQLTALEECSKLKYRFPNVALISDGGIRYAGDIVKAIAIGADAVMIGSLLAGTSETPGEFIEEDDRLYKYYNGMASTEGREKWFDKSKVGLVPEGVSKKVPYLGRSAKHIIEGLCQSLKVGLSYSVRPLIFEKWMIPELNTPSPNDNAHE